MTAEPKQESFEEEYEEYDEFDEEDNERGLSGLVVLLMGVVMLGAFASVVMIAYQQGIKSGNAGAAAPPTIAADPDPVKIENDTIEAAAGNDRAVYDQFDSAAPPAEVLAEAPEEPLAREGVADAPAADPNVVDDAVADRIASLAAADAASEAAATADSGPPVTAPTPANSQTAPAPSPAPAPAAATVAAGDALSGSHLVQVGAFKSEAEAAGNWTRLQGRLGDYLDGKSQDVERADLGDKGVFYRLRIGPFASSGDAKTYCEGLKSRGADCIVRAK
jgi:cell division septation protein DedD